jgi:hypothetical protein
METGGLDVSTATDRGARLYCEESNVKWNFESSRHRRVDVANNHHKPQRRHLRRWLRVKRRKALIPQQLRPSVIEKTQLFRQREQNSCF